MATRKSAAKKPAPKQAAAAKPASKFYALDVDADDVLHLDRHSQFESLEAAVEDVKQECIRDGVANVEDGDDPHVFEVLEVRVVGRYSVTTQHTATATLVK